MLISASLIRIKAKVSSDSSTKLLHRLEPIYKFDLHSVSFTREFDPPEPPGSASVRSAIRRPGIELFKLLSLW